MTHQRLPKDVPLNNSPWLCSFLFRCQDPHTSCGKVGWSTTGNSEIGDLNFVWRGGFSLTLELWILDLFGTISNVLPLSCSLPITRFKVDFEGSPLKKPWRTVGDLWPIYFWHLSPNALVIYECFPPTLPFVGPICGEICGGKRFGAAMMDHGGKLRTMGLIFWVKLASSWTYGKRSWCGKSQVLGS